MTIREFEADIPDVPLQEVLGVLGAPDEKTVVVGQPGPIADGVAVAMRTNGQVLRDATRINLFNHYSDVLPTRFADTWFNIEQALRGAQEQAPLWKRGLWHVNGTVGEALSRLYINQHFPASSKDAVGHMVDDIRTAFRKRLTNAEWMDEPTRIEALAKLDTLRVKIGYPDHWEDDAALKIKPNDALGNLQRTYIYEDNKAAAKLGQPVDRDEWFMLAHETNAYYAHMLNEIVFPAGILEPPFYDPLADPAVNYGAIGAVIGHEITHAFDDQGRAFDASGQLRDWWTKYASRRLRPGMAWQDAR